MNYRFAVTRDYYDRPIGRQYKDVDFIISDMNRNDYGFYSLHKIYATPSILLSQSEAVVNPWIGDFCIMNIHDPKGGHEPYSLYNTYKSTFRFDGELPFHFVTIPTDVDSAKMLACCLSFEQRVRFVQSLHLILGEDIYYHRALSTNIGQQIFEQSFLRSTHWDMFKSEILDDYRKIIEGVIPQDESFNDLLRSRTE